MITGKMYDTLKFLAMIVLPPFAAFILGVGLLLNWDGATVVAGIITLFDTFLGTILQASSSKFKSYQKTDEAFDGYVTPTERDPDTGIPGMQFTVSRHPDDFLNREYVRLKVGLPPATPVKRDPLPDAEVDMAPVQHDGP